MSRSRVRERERIRAAIQTSDPVALAAYAESIRPVVTNLRSLVEDATAEPSKRIHARSFLRREILKNLREIEALIEVATTPTA